MGRRIGQKLSSLGPLFAVGVPSPTGSWGCGVETAEQNHDLGAKRAPPLRENREKRGIDQKPARPAARWRAENHRSAGGGNPTRPQRDRGGEGEIIPAVQTAPFLSSARRAHRDAIALASLRVRCAATPERNRRAVRDLLCPTGAPYQSGSVRPCCRAAAFPAHCACGCSRF